MSVDLTIISPLSWVQDAFKEYFDKLHMSDSSQSSIAFTGTGFTKEKTPLSCDAIQMKPQNHKENERVSLDGKAISTTQRTASATRAQSGNLFDNWTATYDYGFEPAREITNTTAVWITADLLIANNAWRIRHGLSPLLFDAPAPDWIARLPRKLTQRNVVIVSVSEIRAWNELPEGLGERPWSQLSRGRVPEFRAARRNLGELQHDLSQAPENSLITINTHIDRIREEWCVIVSGGKAAASSGYCVHRSGDEDSHDILTVFDGARFHDSYRAAAESAATQAAQASHLDNASIIVGFRDFIENKMPLPPSAVPQPVIIEADPVWCTTPYPFQTPDEINAFLQAIADCRITQSDDGTFKKRNGQSVPESDIYVPDPWMVSHAEHQYDRF
ncbi:hypothetical protein OZX62_03120 [Bifidobacterium sp. ESL0690]|uniref:hypothetical protein n=1 Tax=Bifidobacterium sp. ESL0690 TaxID=2983214 RepID=UPI0023F97BD4|nr:hypothetical protein [Bifidobacterium sp. ESL0690]WEV47286.1 hypothetical protein OZX62_03120 [Bifidobacterium sp. ESL0690]